MTDRFGQIVGWSIAIITVLLALFATSPNAPASNSEPQSCYASGNC